MLCYSVIFSSFYLSSYRLCYRLCCRNSRFRNQYKHERTLGADIRAALDEFNTDVLLLSECGEVGEGLRTDKWLPMVRGICGPGFDVQHQGHYTSTDLRHHEYRMCQHLQVVPEGSVGKPIDLYNCHSPVSKKQPLKPTVRLFPQLGFA